MLLNFVTISQRPWSLTSCFCFYLTLTNVCLISNNMWGSTIFQLWDFITSKSYRIKKRILCQNEDINLFFSWWKGHAESLSTSEVICENLLFLQPTIGKFGSVQESRTWLGGNFPRWKLFGHPLLDLQNKVAKINRT